MAWVTAVVQSQSLAWELMHAVGMAKKEKKKTSELSKRYEGKESGHEEKSDWVANVVKEVGGHLWEGDI